MKKADKTIVSEKVLPEGIYSGPIESLARSPDGEGIIQLFNGDKYEGSFKVGLFCGHGTFECFSPLEDVENVGDAIAGSPKALSPSKRRLLWKYSGNWENGVRAGEGTCYWYARTQSVQGAVSESNTAASENDEGNANDTVDETAGAVLCYNGNWDNDRFHGKGELTAFHTGTGKRLWVYRGMFRNGKPKFARVQFSAYAPSQNSDAANKSEGGDEDQFQHPQGVKIEGAFDEEYQCHGTATVIWPALALKWVVLLLEPHSDFQCC